MVEADPKSITRARLSRRAALTQAAGATAVAAGLAPDTAHATTSLPHPDAALMFLDAELHAADAAWQHALDALARAEQRLFALRPVPPTEILVPAPDGGAPVVPARWAVLRKHLARVHAGVPDLKARLAAARQAWTSHRAALTHPSKPAWFKTAKAAEDQAAARIEVLHRRIAATPAHSWPGLRLKLAVLWARSGRAADESDRADWDLSEALLWSALQDAARASDDAQPRTGPSGLHLRDDSGRPLRILIAEDEPMVAQILQDMITAAGGEIMGVISTALATVGAAGLIHPDAVLMDIHLSGKMDGVDAAGIIRSRRRTPVVFITGAALDAEMRNRLAAHGNVELVFKPIEAAELCTAILRAYKAESVR